MPGRNGPAYLIKTKFIINSLQEEIAAVEAALFIHDKVCSSTEFDVETGRIFFFSLVHQADLFLCPGFGIGNAVGITDKFLRTEAFYNERFVFAVNADCFMYIV